VALARALARDPAVLLLDEPLAALDAHTRLLVRDELGEILDQLAIPTLIVTHDFADAANLADRVAVIDRGQLRQVGTPAELVADPADGFVISFIGGNLLEGTADGREVLLDDGVRIRSSTSAQGRVAVGIYPWDLRPAADPPGDGLNSIEGPLLVHASQGGRARLRIGRLVVECADADARALDGLRTAHATFPPEAVHVVPRD
jgi:ABC-type sulfate/molybdate transport systems ATPase subunit